MRSTLKTYLRSHAFQLLAALGSALAALFGIMPAEAAGLLPLMLLNTDGAGDGAGAGGASPAPTNTSPANGGGQAAPAAGADGKPSPAAAPEKKDESHLPRSKGAVAAERAAARLDKARAAQTKPVIDASAQQPKPGDPPAPGTEGKPVAGQQAAPPGDAKPGEEKPPAGDTPPADIAKAPENWTADRQAKFNAMPPEARVMVQDFHKEMSAGVTHVLTQLSNERSRHQELFTFDEQFNRGPDGAKEVIAELAKRANLEIFFERPEAAETIPEEALANPVKLAKYIEDRAVARAAKATATANEKTANEARVRTAQDTLTREFQDAAKAHTDFATHRPAVNVLLQKAPSLSVEEAYRVVTHDALVKLANEAPALKQKLTTVEMELATLKKKATTLPAGGGTGAPTGEDKFLSPGQRAFKAAETKRAARGAPA
jgi:hypothetical protein